MSDFLDKQFSRQGIFSVFIGLSAGKIVETIIALVAQTIIAQLIAWVVVFPVSLLVAFYWPRFENQYSHLFPWMD